MGTLNRRDAILGAGGLAGLTATGTARAALAGGPSAAEVLRSTRLTGSAETAFLERLGRSAAQVVAHPAGPRPSAAVEAEVVTKLDATGRPFARGLRFACDPRVLNRLTVAGSPLVAKRFCFTADAVSWAPGQGFPVYAEFAPRFDYDTQAFYPQAKAHQLVPVLLGQGYFAGCRANDVCEGATPGAVAFDVNDTHYDDNVGFYAVTLWSWS